MGSDSTAPRTPASAFGLTVRRTWTAVSILLSAASVYGLVVQAWNLLLSPLMQYLLDAYQAAFHPLVDFAFGWLPLHLSPLAKDLLVIWFAVGSSLARTFYFLFETGAGRGVAKWSSPLINRAADDFIFKTPVVRWLFLLAAVVLWPVAMVLLLRKSKICLSPGGTKYALVGGEEDIPTYGGTGATYRVKHDLRATFAMYLLAVVLTVGGLSILNRAGFELPF